jgi:hypothetical protein
MQKKTSLSDLNGASEAELYATKNCGLRTLAEIKRQLQSRNIHLTEDFLIRRRSSPGERARYIAAMEVGVKN